LLDAFPACYAGLNYVTPSAYLMLDPKYRLT